MHTLPTSGPHTWQPFTLTQQSWTDSLLPRKSAPDSTSQLGWVTRETRLSFSPNTTIEVVRWSQIVVDEQATKLTGPISLTWDQYVQYLLAGPTHRSLTDTGRGYSLGGAGFPQITLRPSWPTVSTFHLRAPPDLRLSIKSLPKDLKREQTLNLVSGILHSASTRI
jgi:hypothetical protein